MKLSENLFFVVDKLWNVDEEPGPLVVRVRQEGEQVGEEGGADPDLGADRRLEAAGGRDHDPVEGLRLMFGVEET